jgi:trimeric autotransporter adhesin
LSAAVPQVDNLTGLHMHVIINQLNEEIASVENVNSPTGTPVLGTDLGQFVGRSINDIHRDIIDIAQADQGVQAVFNPTPLPSLNTPAAPFHDDATQTAFITQWIQDSNHLGQMAGTIANNGFKGDIAGLVQQIQTFENNSNAFDQAQGGLWSARFWNEFRTDGTTGTSASALIEGLQTQNVGEVKAAAQQLAMNSADVAGNNLMVDGGSYANIVAVAQATAVTPNTTTPAQTPVASPPSAGAGGALTATDLYNDATTREIGGVGPDQVNLIASDLIGVQQMLSAAVPQINNLSDLHTHVIINQLNEEIASVENVNSPTGTPVLGTDLGQFVGRSINDIHRDIIDIAQADQGVQAVFNPTPLPSLNTPAAPFHDDATQTAFITQWIQDSNHLGQMAGTIANNGFKGDIAGLVQQIQTFENNSNAFDQAQGGLWSARFWNEFRTDGTTGTSASALIEGLQTQNVGEVNAAAQQLAMNSADVAGNNLMADGGSYANVVAAAQATAVTTDTTTPAQTAVSTTPSGGAAGATTAVTTNTTTPVQSPVASTPSVGVGDATTAVTTNTTTPAQTPVASTPSAGVGDATTAHSTPTADASATDHAREVASHMDTNHAGAGTVASDIEALIQAMQTGNASAVNPAVTALGTAGGETGSFFAEDRAGDTGIPAFTHHHHFEHIWG